jgi:hypothetical protein
MTTYRETASRRVLNAVDVAIDFAGETRLGEGAGRCRGTWAEEEAREQAADALLRALPKDPDYPTYTDYQLSRHGQGICVASVETLPDARLSSHVDLSAWDELAFLASVTPLTRRERLCLRAWLLGWTQVEMAARWARLDCGLQTQQSISRALRSALLKCYDARAISFTQFSRRFLYHKPLPRRKSWRALVCRYCREEYVASTGVGRYCSLSCREAAQHRRAAGQR